MRPSVVKLLVAGVILGTPSVARAQWFTSEALWRQAVKAAHLAAPISIDLSRQPGYTLNGCDVMPMAVQIECSYGTQLLTSGALIASSWKAPASGYGPPIWDPPGVLSVHGEFTSMYVSFTSPAYAFSLWSWVDTPCFAWDPNFPCEPAGYGFVVDPKPGYGASASGFGPTPTTTPQFLGYLGAAPLQLLIIDYHAPHDSGRLLAVANIQYATATPEPATLALLAPALLAVAVLGVARHDRTGDDEA